MDSKVAVLDWPAHDFRRVMRATLVAASKDAARPHLMATLIRRKAGVLAMFSTDGHIVFRWTASESSVADKGSGEDFECAIPQRVVRDVVSVTRRAEDKDRVWLQPGKAEQWDVRVAPYGARFAFMPIKNYPPVDVVIPKTAQEHAVSCTVDGRLLARVTRAFSIATGYRQRQVGLRVQFTGGALDPMVVTGGQRAVFAVVMPMRDLGRELAIPTEKAEAAQ